MPDPDLLLRAQSLVGLVVFLAITYGIGVLYNRRAFAIPWRVVVFGMALQLVFALFILKTAPGKWVFEQVDRGVRLLLSAATEGAGFLFGNLARSSEVPVRILPAGGGELTGVANTGAFFAFNILPTIIFFSAILAVLYYLGVMRLVVEAIAWVMRRTMGTSGAETLSSAANIFVGQTEAPLFVRPFLATMTRSELMAVMVGGFANIASGVLGVYAVMLGSLDRLGAAAIPDAGAHLLAASAISAPAGLVTAKLILPETEVPVTSGQTRVVLENSDTNVFDAAVRGTRDGVILAANVGAVLIVFVAAVWLINQGLILLGGQLGMNSDLTLERILGWLFAPVAWLCGASRADSAEVGSLIGIKTVLNEFYAYTVMSDQMLAQGTSYLSPRSKLIALYALCGFANFASVGIQIGGIGVLAPTRRSDLARIGLLAMVGGTIASLLTACVVGMIL